MFHTEYVCVCVCVCGHSQDSTDLMLCKCYSVTLTTLSQMLLLFSVAEMSDEYRTLTE